MSAHASLAQTYLAIADDPMPPADQRSATRALCAVVATVVLALAAPLAWTAAASGKPLDLPAATVAKGSGSDDDDEVDDGDPWAATHV
jgi:hypothetical protein